jgi:ADP-L-glycero-D-manno-heptose 6-epimerase
MDLLKDKPVLVTGAAGFIGSALIHALNQRGITDIVAADFLGNDLKWKNLVPLKFADYVEADQLLDHLKEDPFSHGNFGAIFHLGANSSTTESNARHLVENNFEYTKHLAQLSLKNGWRFVYASSAATYGEGEQGFVDDGERLETLRPINMYAYSKQLFDMHALRHQYLDEVVGIKYFNIYGPNEFHKGGMRSMILKAFEQIQQTGVVSLFKSDHPDYRDGEQLRDFLYVKDAVDATIYLAENQSANGIYNVGSGEANTWLRMIKAVFAALDKDAEVNFIDLPEHLKGKYQYYTKADITRIRNEGWSHRVTEPEDAVKDYVQNYLIPHKRLGEENNH